MKTLVCLFLVLSASIALSIDYGESGFKSKNYDFPKRELSVIITPEGYYPNKFAVFAGEEVKFFVTNLSKKQSCMIVREKDFYLSSSKGKISEGSILFEKPGEYSYYCPTGNIRGQITVLERPSVKAARDIASQKQKKSKIRYWLPKEE